MHYVAIWVLRQIQTEARPAICLDKPDSNELRLANRTAHLDYLRANSKTIKSCGPFLSDDGLAMVGSMLIIEAEDRAGVDEVLAKDPSGRPASSARSTCAAGVGS
jgi:uncharacterized protein YciI